MIKPTKRMKSASRRLRARLLDYLHAREDAHGTYMAQQAFNARDPRCLAMLDEVRSIIMFVETVR